ncbi:MAG: transmembrane sensor [Flavobacteriales bacterium]|jgi:transmembrane sensor
MKNKQENIDTKNKEESFSKMKVNYSKSKEGAWTEMESKLDSTNFKKEAVVIKMNFKRWSLVASLVLIVGVIAFMKFFTIRIVSSQSEIVVVTLPDNSTVTLRGGSALNYNPYWWFTDRSIYFEGEAFFDVVKGGSFSVNSKNGVVQVLGTSFNIYARNERYEVFCKTGKVKVITAGDSQIITPGMLAKLDEKGMLSVANDLEASEILSWQTKLFNFSNTSLDKVVQEVEREYNVAIKLVLINASNYHFSGKFERDKNIKDLLNSIAFSLNLQLEQVNKSSFVLKKQ